MSTERLVLVDNPNSQVITDLTAALAAVQTRVRIGLLTPEDCGLYLRALARVRDWINDQPEEYRLKDSSLQWSGLTFQLLLAGKGNGTRTTLRLVSQDGQLYISVNRSSGSIAERICRLELDLNHPFRKLKALPAGLDVRGGTYFLTNIWMESKQVESVPFASIPSRSTSLSSIIHPKVSMEPYQNGLVVDVQLEKLAHQLILDDVEKSTGKVADVFRYRTGSDTSKPVTSDFYHVVSNPQLSLFGEE
jgi:hypothetical protein